MFNFWRSYPRWKPKKEGWYLCTTSSERVILLQYIRKPDVGNVWLDTSRKSVFNGYKVYKPSRAAIEDNRIWEDNLCERDDIIAWKKVPKAKKVRNGGK